MITIAQLNDFIFCPLSIYFHMQYDDSMNLLYKSKEQNMGSRAHTSIDCKNYSTSKNVLQGITVFCEAYFLLGKIDLFYIDEGKLVERKKHITKIYDGQIFQVYGQYYALKEMGYQIKKIVIHSLDDNKNYLISLPEDDIETNGRFEKTLKSMISFDSKKFVPISKEKCNHCIYSNICDRVVD